MDNRDQDSIEINQVDGKSPKRSGLVYSRLNGACWLLLLHELLERFSFYGMKGLLTLFLIDYLNFSNGSATSIYHLFTGICYLMPVVGAIISDNYLGRFKTVIVFGIVYLISFTALTLSTLAWNRIGPLISIFILSIGAGIIKPCVAAFGGDQTPPHDEEALDAFFSLFYICINIGAFASQLLTPILKETVDCVDGQCYPLAFGVPAAVFFITYMIFIAGKPLYRFLEGEDNVVVRSVKLIGHSISRKFRLRKSGDKRESFLDYGDDLYDLKFINDVKIVLSVLFLYLPFPIFWALFDQQGSRWSVQASQMNGKLAQNLVIYPEQMQMINPLIIVIVIPIFNNIVYPLLAKCTVLTRPPTRMVVGYLFAAMSFVYAGVLQFEIDKGLVAQPLAAGESLVSFLNLGPCSLIINNTDLPVGQLTTEMQFSAPSTKYFIMSSPQCSISDQTFNITLSDKSKYTIGVATSGRSIVMSSNIQDREVNAKGSKFRFLASPDLVSRGGVVEMMKGKNPSGSVIMNFSDSSSMSLFSTNYLSQSYGQYTLRHRIGDTSTVLGSLMSQSGLIASVGLLQFNATGPASVVLAKEVTPRLILIAWQFPQYLLMTIGEVLFSVTSMSFAYSESPASMKAIMQSVFLVTIFFGNIIVTIVAALPSLPNQSWEFLLFAGLVLLAGVLQGGLAYSFEKDKKKRLDRINENQADREGQIEMQDNQDVDIHESKL